MSRRAGPVVDAASAADAVVRVVAGLEAPLPLSTLGTLVRRSGVPLGNPALREVLDRLVAAGVAFEHPVGNAANPSPRYWRRPASTFVEVNGLIDRGWLVEIEADCVAEK